MPDTIVQTTLHLKEAGSDKVYIPAIIKNSGSGFDVIAAYGRRGATLQHTVKASAIDVVKARKLYDKLINEKVAKGYRVLDGDPTAIAAVSERDGRCANLPIQLLNPVTESELDALLDNPAIIVQEKKDGDRRLLVISDSDVAGVNRKGLYVPLPPAIVEAAASLPTDTIIDGEIIADVLFAFDAQRIAGNDLTGNGFEQRYDALRRTVDATPGIEPAITMVPCVAGNARRAYTVALRDSGAEGVVLRYASAAYTSGRPNSGGTALKHKYYSSASVLVVGQNDRHSVALAVKDGPICLNVGNVTIPPSLPLPRVGAIVEVRYLYAFRGGSLYQPTFLGVRTDLDESDCTLAQLSFKAEVA